MFYSHYYNCVLNYFAVIRRAQETEIIDEKHSEYHQYKYSNFLQLYPTYSQRDLINVTKFSPAAKVIK